MRSRPGGAARPARAGPAPPFDALTVDAWYTLIYLSPAEHRALDGRRHRLWAEPLLRAGFSRAAVARTWARRDRWVRAEEARGHTPSVAEQLARWARWTRGRVAVDELGEELDAALLQSKVLVAPGAREALRDLNEVGIPLSLVSNVLNESGHAARTVLDRLGLLAEFRTVYLSSEHRWAKPSPEPFRRTARFLEVPPARIVHLGDLTYDLLGAQAAGFHAWWYAGLRRFNRYLPGQVVARSVPPRDVVRHWHELPRRFAVRR